MYEIIYSHSPTPRECGFPAHVNESKEMLYERWHMEMDVERMCAERENRSPVMLPSPTVEDIKRTAENLYEFVQNR
jgi:hypothetical protein